MKENVIYRVWVCTMLLFAVACNVKAQVAEAMPSINIVGVVKNNKSLALGGLANVVSEDAFGLQIGGLYNHIGDAGCGLAIAGLANTTLGHYYGAQIGGVWNYAIEAKGLMIGGLGNMTRGDFDGLQLAGLTNIAKQTRGWQISGLANIAEDTYGLQLAGLVNVSKDMCGLQLSGLTNIADDVYGLQLSGLANVADDVYGLQFAGLFNVARRARGVQFAALVNVAEESDFPIGLINIIKQGDKGVAFTYDMLGNTTLSFRSGGKYAYGILGVGCNPRISDKFVAEAGYGFRIPICDWVSINNELKATAMGFKSDNMPRNFSYLLAPSVTLWKHCNLFGGPSLNFLMSDADEANGLPLGKNLWGKESDKGLRCLYVGYQVGLQYIF